MIKRNWHITLEKYLQDSVTKHGEPVEQNNINMSERVVRIKNNNNYDKLYKTYY